MSCILFAVYFMTMSVTRDYVMFNDLIKVGNKMDQIWKEAVLA